MISVLVSSYGEDKWLDLAIERAYPAAVREAGDDNVVLHHEPDGTNATSRNNAAAAAQNDWLLFLDADDELSPGFIPAMTNAVNAHPDLWTLFTPAVSYVMGGRPRPPRFWPEVPLDKANWLIIGTLISKDLFDEVGGFREFPHGLEDWNLWARCAQAGASVVKVPDAVYVAHWNPKSKHRVLFGDRKLHAYWYQQAGEDAVPGFEMPDPRRRLRR